MARKKQTIIEVLPINTITFANFSPGTIGTIHIRLPYHNKINFCITDFIVHGKKNNFTCKIIGTIANNEEYGGYTGTIYIRRDGFLKFEVQT